MPKARATSEATAPGSIAAATIRSLSARDQRRRRCTDVITSTCVFVMGAALGLLIGLAATARSRKAARTGWVPYVDRQPLSALSCLFLLQTSRSAGRPRCKQRAKQRHGSPGV